MADSFVHLHVHTSSSLLDGASKIPELVAAAAADGQPALGITDHGNLYGVPEFYKECHKQGVKPVIGLEAYMAYDSVDERPQTKGSDDSGGETVTGQKAYYHLTLLAERPSGYQNLIKLSSRSFLEGYYRKPRIDWNILADHSLGLIATSGCLGGLILQALLRDDFESAKEIGGKFLEIFGRRNFFIELQDHGLPEQKKTNSSLLDLAGYLRAGVVLVNDTHYTHRHDAENHDALLCVNTGALKSQENRFKFHGQEHYLKSAEEMRGLFPDLPSASANTLWIADRCNVEIPFGQQHFPKFPIPEGFENDDQYLAHLVLTEAERKFGTLSDEVVAQIAFELRTISDMGFSSYFLIVWDLIRFAQSQGIRIGAGRGSAAGSLCLYVLGVTGLNPLEYGLMFERFLNPDRISPPDADIDMDTRYRDRMINYMAEKYGEDSVAQIITFSTIKARAAVRDVTRVLGYPYSLGDRISKSMPPLIMGRDTPIAACLEVVPGHEDGYAAAQEFRDLYDSDPDVRTVVEAAKGLEGLKRQDGIHAAGVVVGDQPLVNLVPIQRKPEKDGTPGPIVTQWDMKTLDELGLLKMDFLGLRNLDVISETQRLCDLLDLNISVDEFSLDDPATFEMLSAGHTVGVFQLEGRGMTELIMRLRPTSFHDIAALVALYRPGPMGTNMHLDYADRKNGRQSVSLFHKEAEDILAETYGLPIYQEQIMSIARKFAGYTLAQADLLRRAMGKKDRDKMAIERENFVSGCAQLGYGEEFALNVFNMIERFADYGFNKSHAYGYGFLAYQTAYLKCHYPGPYMAALCSSVDKIERLGKFLTEARRIGIEIHPPDIQRSEINFTATQDSIVVGLSSVSGISALASAIVSERERNGRFENLLDFVKRMLPLGLNIKSFRALIYSGALDCFGHTRLGLISVDEKILNSVRKIVKKDDGTGQLFALDLDIPIPTKEFHKKDLLKYERQYVGIYVSGHPLDDDQVQSWIEASDVKIVSLEGLEKEGWAPAVVGSVAPRRTKAGAMMATLTLEDQSHSLEVVAFPKTWADLEGQIGPGSICLAKVQPSQDERSAVLREAVVRPEGASLPPNVLRIHLPRGFSDDTQSLAALKGILLTNKGSTRVFLHISKGTYADLGDDFLVHETSGLISEIKKLLATYGQR